MRMIMKGTLAAAVVCGLVAGSSMAADISVEAKKVIVVDKLTAASKAKLVYVCKDAAAGITTGSGTDVATISAQIEYQSASLGSAGGADMPQGAGWLVNKPSVSKYVNKNAPGPSGNLKVGVIKPNKLLKAVIQHLGDDGNQIDIFQGGAAADSADLSVQYTIINGAETNRHCSESNCVRKIIAGGTGAKLVCKSAVPRASVTCPTGGSPSGSFLD